MISLLVAHDPDRVIGVNNELPWHIPEELAYFKKVSMGKAMIMGRKHMSPLVDLYREDSILSLHGIRSIRQKALLSSIAFKKRLPKQNHSPMK